MFAYFTIYYEIKKSNALLVKRMKEIMSIAFILMILIVVTICQNLKMPLEGAVAASSHISGVISGERDHVLSMNGVGSNILLINSCLESERVKEKMPSAAKTENFSEPDIVKAAWFPNVIEHVQSVDEGINLTDDLAGSRNVEDGEVLASEEALDMIENPAQNETDSEEEIKNGEPSVMVLSGFICDESGKIIGCDGASVTDEVLCLPSDGMCTGIAAGALASLGGSVCEIYIPANITMIENGAFDGLEGLMYIEVHPDNPVYGSSAGILFEK